MQGLIELKLPKKLEVDLQNFGNHIAKHVAIQVRDLMYKEYEVSVQDFYYSYTPETHRPKKYKRLYTLPDAAEKYYKNPHNTRYHGGIALDPSRMGGLHHEDDSIVLGMALQGYHGQYALWTPNEIYKHLDRYQDILFMHAEDLLGDTAIEAAKKYHYDVLEF